VLEWPVTVGYGAIGGAVVEAIALWGRLSAWQTARRQARSDLAKPLPPFSAFFDLWPDLAVAATRIALGAIAGFVFHGGVTSPSAAMAVGAAGPALLAQFGSATRGGAVETVEQSGQAAAVVERT
jgi:hypothetical protein